MSACCARPGSSASTACRAAAEARIAGTFSKPLTRGSVRSSVGNGARQRAPLRTSSTPTPAGPPHLWADAAAADQPVRAAGAGRRWHRRRRTRARRLGSTVCTVPTSGLACWTASTPASGGQCRPTCPSASTPTDSPTYRRAPSPTSGRRGRPRSARRPSAPGGGTRGLGPARARGAPRWTAAVPEEVKVTSSGRTPRQDAVTSRALSSRSRALRPGPCSRSGSAYPFSRAASRRLPRRRMQRLGGHRVEVAHRVHNPKLPAM